MRLQESLQEDGYLDESTPVSYQAIYEATEHIRHKFYGELDEEAFVDAILEEMIEQLDPYSHYFGKAGNSNYDRYMEGLYRGVGLEFVQKQDSTYAYQVISGSPAAKAGIRRGDLIVSVDSFSLGDKLVNLDSIMRDLRKEVGSTINIGTMRLSNGKSQVHQLKIEEVHLPLIEDYVIQSEDSESKTSYVHVKRFYSDVFRDFMEVLEEHKLTYGTVENLIIDLRDNPGGVVEETIKILNQLIDEKDKLLLTTRSKIVRDKEYKSNGRSFLDVKRIVIICNKHSASASEILAGVLQDYDKAVIVGQNSYGKGLIQQNYDLSNEGSINLSIGEYILPSGRHIYGQTKEDTSYYSLVNKRPISSIRGVPADILTDECSLTPGIVDKIKDYVIEYGLWDQVRIPENGVPIASLIKDEISNTDCAGANEQTATWAIVKNSVERGSVISQSSVDASMQRAMEVILSEEYDRILGQKK